MEFFESNETASSYIKTNFYLEEAFKQTLKELDNIQLTEKYDDTQLQEMFTPTLVISTILALPSMISSIVKAFSFVIKQVRKLFSDSTEEFTIVTKLLEFTDKWHHSYIKVIEKILVFSGIFKRLNITDPKIRTLSAEVVFYTIIFGFAIHGGLASAKSVYSMVHHGNLHHINVATLETVLTSIKSKEVVEFVRNFG